jgi:GT2 family glycosyltransferase
MTLAVITTVAGRHDHLRLQLAGLAGSVRRPDVHVVVSMDDPEIADICRDSAAVLTVPRQNGRLPVAAARNAGAAHAADLGADLLVFLDVDCVPDPSLLGRYQAVARQHADALISGPVAYLPAVPEGGYVLDELPALACGHPARPLPAPDEVSPLAHRLFWSLSFAVSTATFARIGGFYAGYSGYGGEDTDFAELARAHDIPHLYVGGAWAYHQWHPVQDPPLGHLLDILRNGRIFRDRWGRWPMEGWLAGFARLGLIEHDPLSDDWTLTGPGDKVATTTGVG